MGTGLIKFIGIIFLSCINGLQAQSLRPFLGPDVVHMGLMDWGYEVVVPAQYRSIRPVGMYRAAGFGFWVTNEKHQQGLLDSKGKEIIPAKYDKLHFWSGSAKNWKTAPLVLFAKNQLWGAINPKNGEVIVQPQFKKIYGVDKGLAIVKGKNDLQGLMKANGDIIVKPKFKNISWESHGFRVVQNQQGKYGFLNTQGKLVIPCRYDNALNFQGKFSKVAIGKQWYYINRYGGLVNKTTPPEEAPIEEKVEVFRIPNKSAWPRFHGLRGKYKYTWRKEDLKQNLAMYVQEYSRLRKISRQEKVTGEVTVQFVVSEDGQLHNIKVLKGLDKKFDREAVRLLRRLGRWIPARFYGRGVISLNIVTIPFGDKQ